TAMTWAPKASSIGPKRKSREPCAARCRHWRRLRREDVMGVGWLSSDMLSSRMGGGAQCWQPALSLRGEGLQVQGATAFVLWRDAQGAVRRRQQARRLLGPFDQFQAGAGEEVAKACVLPLLRVVEAVEVEVPDRHAGRLMGFAHG